MNATLRWRKLCETYTLLGWDNVLMRDELPFEYTNAPGPKFWYVPPVVVGKVAYVEHIRLGSKSEDHSGYVRMMLGSVLFEEDHDKLVVYLKEAAKRLSRIRAELESAEEITVEV
jgi:hypothetical protein